MSATDTNVPADTTTTEPATTSPTTDEPAPGTSQPLIAAEPDVEPLTVESIKLPDGYEAAPAFLGEFVGIANDLKLTAEQANKLSDLAIRTQNAQIDKLTEHWENQQREWFAEAQKQIPEWDQTLGKIAALNKEYGSSEFAEVMHLTGAEKHPAVLKFLAKVANALVVEGKAVSGAPASAPKTLAERLFPNQRSA